MYFKFAFATLAVLIGNEVAIAQQIPATTTAAELWNPWTWFWPYAIAASEGYRDYFQKAQKATNELYMQAEKLNAFPWITGKPSSPQGNNQGGNGGQNNQGGQTQPNQSGDNGQNNQAGPSQPNQSGDKGQNNQGGSTQPNQGGDKGQNNQEDSNKPNQGDNQTPAEDAPQEQEDGKTDSGLDVNA